MRKIPTLFVRDENNLRYVTREVHPDCTWVAAGEGVPTRKYDGTCVMRDPEGGWWARREVKPGKERPAEFVAVEHDQTTGKLIGWEPMSKSGWLRWFEQALEYHIDRFDPLRPGTYELIGPKINGNPERVAEHQLVAHATARQVDAPRDFDQLAAWISGQRIEGVVWHHPDGRMAKIKKRDFPREGATP